MLAGEGGRDDTKGGRRIVIEYNHFKNLGVSSSGEAIFIGGCKVTRVNFKISVRYNLFENCSCDPECITSKSCSNVYQYNIFREKDWITFLKTCSGNT